MALYEKAEMELHMERLAQDLHLHNRTMIWTYLYETQFLPPERIPYFHLFHCTDHQHG